MNAVYDDLDGNVHIENEVVSSITFVCLCACIDIYYAVLKRCFDYSEENNKPPPPPH